MTRTGETVVTDTIACPNICIVSSGRAGITLAMEQARTEEKILLLKSGGIEPNEAGILCNAGSMVRPTSGRIVAMELQLMKHPRAISTRVPIVRAVPSALVVD